MNYLHWRSWLDWFVQWQFLAALKREMHDPDGYPQIKREIRRQLSKIYAANAHRIQHPPDRFHLTWVSLLMAAYHVLLPVVDSPQQAMALIGAAIQVPFRKLTGVALLVRYGISPFQPGSAFPKLAQNFKAKGERFFGPSFIYEQAVLTDRQSFVNIRRCLFFEILAANGVPELTRLLCPIDTILMDELNKPKYGIRFERSTAIGFGDDLCRFQITNTAELGSLQGSRTGQL
jgi:hypothetical protein